MGDAWDRVVGEITGTQPSPEPAAVALSFDPVAAFTPASADPKLAAALAGRATSLTDFKFTPAAAKGRPSQVRVAIRARAAPTLARGPAVPYLTATPTMTPPDRT